MEVLNVGIINFYLQSYNPKNDRTLGNALIANKALQSSNTNV
jgi:hypothetical protein